jgi:Ca2+-binding RTX toxin-like protein
MTEIKFVIDEIKANDTTDTHQDFGIFRGSSDEIFFVATGGSSSTDRFTKRIPNENDDDGYDIDKGQTLSNIALQQFSLGDGEQAALVVNLSEDDGTPIIEVIESAIETLLALGKLIGSIVTLNLGMGVEAATQLVPAAIELYDAINKTDNQSIGAFSVAVSNEDGKPDFTWAWDPSRTNTVRLSEDYNSARFQSTGSSANYTFQVSAQILDTVTSSLSTSLEGRSEKNLILIGNNPINGTGNNLNNILTGNEDNNILNGLAGNDTLWGRGGNDTLIRPLAKVVAGVRWGLKLCDR